MGGVGQAFELAGVEQGVDDRLDVLAGDESGTSDLGYRGRTGAVQELEHRSSGDGHIEVAVERRCGPDQLVFQQADLVEEPHHVGKHDK